MLKVLLTILIILDVFGGISLIGGIYQAITMDDRLMYVYGLDISTTHNKLTFIMFWLELFLLIASVLLIKRIRAKKLI